MRLTAEVCVLAGIVAGTSEIDGVRTEYQSTPPMPATSSPGMDMDVSPVPFYKGAYVAQVEINSPTPVASPNYDVDDDDDDDEVMLESPAPIARRICADAQKAAELVYTHNAWTGITS